MIDKNAILEYPTLDHDARGALERAVREDGRYVELLDEMISLAQLMDEAGRTHIGEDELAYLVAQESVEDIQPPFAHAVRKAAEGEEDLTEELDTLRRRAGALLESHDAVAHFASLRTSSLDQSVAPGTRDASSAVREDRSPARRARLRRGGLAERWSMAVAVFLVALAGVLVLALMPTQSEIAQLGHFEADEINPDRFLMTARSADSFTLTATDSLLVQAVDHLRAARNVRLGIFPSYDQEELSEATALLNEVIARLPGDDFVSLEARYLRARAFLLQENPYGAIQDLEELLQYEGTRNVRARSLLVEIRAVLE